MNNAEEVRDAEIRSLPDLDLLRRLLKDDEIVGAEREAFEAMRAQGRMSKKQRAWAEEACRRVTPLQAKNVPRGREVVTPAVLLNLPKKPPQRRPVE